MRNRICSGILLLLFMLQTNMYAQYVTLEGKQFKDEFGNDFYPICMNYGVQIAHDPGSTSYYITPNNHYGAHNDFECNNQADCFSDIHSDFVNIKAMGFNTIHVWGIVPEFDPVAASPGIAIWENPVPTPWYPINYQFTTPYSSDPVFGMLLNSIDAILADAAGLGLKVIIDGQKGDAIHVMGNPSSDDDYNELLAVLATNIASQNAASQAACMAYILVGEPYYNSDGVVRSKENVCSITNRWYNTIKSIDPNHLIGSGGMSFYEVLEYDPAVVKMDFYFPHFYPDRKLYEDVIPFTQPNYSTTVDRVKGAIYWLGQNCPIPWMVGESSFAATNISPITNNTINGTLAEQKLYFEESLDWVRNCGGAGFSAWQYQEVWWDDGGFQDGLGLLFHGDPQTASLASLQKPAIDAFIGYFDASGNPPTPFLVSPPSNYYDPHNGNVFNSSNTNKVSGILVDQNGPMKDAVVEALNWLEKIDLTPTNLTDNNFKYTHSWVYTFSKADGSFEIIPYNYETIGDNRIVYIRGSATASESFERGQPWPWTDVQMATNVSSITLNRGVNYNTFVSGQFVPISVTQNFSGYNSILINNSTIDGNGSIGGISDITARNEIHIQGEFNSLKGSETHIFLSETNFNCNDFAAFVIRSNIGLPIEERYIETNEQKSEIELQFMQTLGFVIFPNPTSGLFALKINTQSQNQPLAIKIRTTLGNIVEQIYITEKETEIDVTELSKGIYFLELITDKKLFTKKLIIN